MYELFDTINFYIYDYSEFIILQFRVRELSDWFLFVFPFFVFGELPRYVIPAIMLGVCKLFGLPRINDEQKTAFVERQPSVSILLVGYNEEATIVSAVDSLLELNYSNLEIIVIDDHSEDTMFDKVRPYADKGLVKLYRNISATGRAGRPNVSNMALALSSGEFVISVDADTSFDNTLIRDMIGPFHNPKIGAVAGNLKIKNKAETLCTSFQVLEYLLSVDLWKRWLNLLGMNMQASGAIGAFRRSALDSVGGWDPELAEDADLSLKLKKSGWTIEFAPNAVAMTNVPDTFNVLSKQRYRWDKGGLRTYFRKHASIMNIKRFGIKNAAETAMEFFFSYFLTLLYGAYVVFLIAYYTELIVPIYLMATVVYSITSTILCGIGLIFSNRWRDELRFMFLAPLLPFFKGYFKLIRFYALFWELFHVNYEESYLPESAWKNASRW